MRHKDEALMNRIRAFAEDFYVSEGRSPSTAEIGNAVGVTKGTVYRYLLEMDEKGMISYNGKTISTKKTARARLSSTPAKVYDGAVPCGPLDTIDASVSEIVPLPSAIFGKGELYIIRAQGKSMIDAGIDDGDMVIVEKKRDALIGEIVVALDGENRNSLKRLGWDAEKGCYFLHPENPTMDDIYVRQLSVQGVARFVLKSV